MIDIQSKQDCCGCSACVQRCPKHCITMCEDEEGFIYPHIDMTLCIDCGLCEKVCPVRNPDVPKQPLQVYAAKHVNSDVMLHSSSGGVFIVLATEIIKRGGVVFGARFDKQWAVIHSYVEKLDELPLFMRSKYVQSCIGSVYEDVESFLKRGRYVLFAGTPCQIAGLHRFLHKEYEQLLTVDVVCHGVPSPMIWREYLAEICKDAHLTLQQITSVNFRAKQNEGYEWKQYGLVVKSKQSEKTIHDVVYACDCQNDPYLKGFIRNLYIRPSCHHCPAKAGSSNSDLTLGDFWGVESIEPAFYDGKGVNSVFVHTDKGRDFLACLKDIFLMRVDYQQAILFNSSYYESTPLSRQRDKFWNTYFQDHQIKTAVESALYISKVVQLYCNIRNVVIYQSRRIIRYIYKYFK